MTETRGRAWRPAPITLDEPERVRAVVVAAFQDVYERCFADELAVNHALPIELRAWRRTGPWGVGLLLTPWVLGRLWLTDTDPGLPIPAGWGADERAEMGPVVVGPTVRFRALETDQRAHLNYHRSLGHYLIQPLIQNMEGFSEPREVYEAWEQVIAHRDRVAEEQERDCPWQQEISRREFFSRFRGRGR